MKFLYGRTLGQPDKVAFLSMPRKDVPLPTVLTTAEIQRVLDGFLVAKYRVFFALIYATGLCIREASLLETRDINAFQQVIQVRNGKGGRDRLVPMPTKLYGLLRSYWKHERPPEPRLFASKAGKPICHETARRALLCASARAGIGKVVTPHMLRHSFATNLLEHGTDLRKIQVVLGHGSIRSTTIYTRVSLEQVASVRSPMEDLNVEEMGYPRPRFDIADIVRAHRKALEERYRLSRSQKRVLTAISRCRTAALGGHLTIDLCQRMRWQSEVCTGCGREHPVYNSCRNRHCPKCQALAQQKWIDARAERILCVPHFHLVFTLPSELKPLARRHPAAIYNALFRATSELLLELGRTRLKATLGLTLVLHTWTRDLRFHPHIHVLATAGGLSLGGKRFVHARKDYLFPVEVMGRLLRGKVLDALRALHRKGASPYLGKRSFGHLMASLAAHKCRVVYAKAPFRRSQHVLSYLGRYTHRVGIANSRLQDVGPAHVTFRTRGKGTATLQPVDFLARFIQHVLPDGFHKIRHAGLYASPALLEQARTLLPTRPTTKAPEPSSPDEPLRCPYCGGLIQRILLARAPPPEAA